MVAATLFALFGSTAFVIGFRPISAFWLHQPLAVAPLLLMGMAVWAVLEAMGTALSTLLNAANVLRYQLATSAVFALACIAGKAWVIGHGHGPGRLGSRPRPISRSTSSA